MTKPNTKRLTRLGNRFGLTTKHRDILAGLFPDDIRPTVMLPSSNQPGQFNLEFYNVDEKDIRKIAELLKSLRP